MKEKLFLLVGFSLAFLSGSCLPANVFPSTATPQQPTAALLPDIDASNPYPLAGPGPYGVGMRSFKAVDSARGDREVGITVWYPAVPAAGDDVMEPVKDARPDGGGAPYPLILSSTKVAKIFAPYLVSRGFTWASVDGIDYYLSMGESMIDQPLDILFALNQVAIYPPAGLEGLIDTEHAGAIGYSFDGYNALAMSGARIDPAYYLAQCPDPDLETQAILGSLSAFSCAPARDWDEFIAHAGKSVAESEDGLWQPMTDERIRAVMPMACEGWWLFGERGLAAVDRPILMLAGSKDELYKENVLIFNHLGTSDKSMIVFIDQDHMMIYDTGMIERIAHFAIAFFGCHLQGRRDLAQYFSQEFVASHADLAWELEDRIQ